MQEAHHFRRIFIDFYNIISKFHRMTGGETDTVDTVNRCHQTQQLSEGAHATLKRIATIRINVLAQQVNFTHALRGQLCHFKQYVIARAADYKALHRSCNICCSLP
ncbi:hypothetical protein SRABI106_04366 [Rahnella aquatilis]|nr:hypothetical protein SRABI106_04366 [Rahnella aquatilis]